MSIKAKTEGTLRVVGMVLIFIGLIGEFATKLFLKDNIFIPIIFLCFSSPWLLVSFALKLEKSFFYENMPILVIAAIILSLLCAISAITFITKTGPYSLILQFLAISLLLSSWHFSLTIKKKYKILFLCTGLGYIVLKIIQIGLTGLDFSILSLILVVILGTILIIGAELSMIKKGYLNYL
ncbi:MAG: hypothetical protein R6U96_17875 [Promethearchaeia archaeon]